MFSSLPAQSNDPAGSQFIQMVTPSDSSPPLNTCEEFKQEMDRLLDMFDSNVRSSAFQKSMHKFRRDYEVKRAWLNFKGDPIELQKDMKATTFNEFYALKYGKVNIHGKQAIWVTKDFWVSLANAWVNGGMGQNIADVSEDALMCIQRHIWPRVSKGCSAPFKYSEEQRAAMINATVEAWLEESTKVSKIGAKRVVQLLETIAPFEKAKIEEAPPLEEKKEGDEMEKVVEEEAMNDDPVEEEAVDVETMEEDPVEEDTVEEEPVEEDPVEEETMEDEAVEDEAVEEEPVEEEPVEEEPVEDDPVEEDPVEEDTMGDADYVEEDAEDDHDDNDDEPKSKKSSNKRSREDVEELYKEIDDLREDVRDLNQVRGELTKRLKAMEAIYNDLDKLRERVKELENSTKPQKFIRRGIF